jgi:hypothetical protein
MVHPEFPAAGDQAYRVAEELRTTFSIKGNPYSNIVLGTDHPDFVDVYDPNILVDREALTLYWPGGTPDGARDFETISLLTQEDRSSNAELAHQATTIRKAILGASIGQPALGRVPADMRQEWEDTKAQTRRFYPAPILYAKDYCQSEKIPLALCQTSRVVGSNMAPEGAHMMHLWYPQYISPKPVLATLKLAVRKAIQQNHFG